MSRHSHAPQKSLTAAQVEQWITATSSMRLHLHVVATEPWHSVERHAAFIQMSELVLDAIEEVWVISASLREGSQRVRGASADLRAHATQLLEQCTKSVEHMAQCVPVPQERQEAERRMLDMFKANIRPREQ